MSAGTLHRNGRQLAERRAKLGGFEERCDRGGRCFVEDRQIAPFEDSTIGRWRVRDQHGDHIHEPAAGLRRVEQLLQGQLGRELGCEVPRECGWLGILGNLLAESTGARF